MRSIRALAALFALSASACGGSGAPANTDGGSDRPADMEGGGSGGHVGGAGGAGVGGRAGTGGTSHAGGAGGMAGTGGIGGASGGGGAGGGAGGGGGAGAAGGAKGAAGEGGAAGPHDGGSNAAACATNPDPCLCGRPDANSLSASECAQEKACRAAGGVWEPYVVFLPEGGSYGPRCQSPDGAVLAAF
jgi:hypothetical protein